MKSGRAFARGQVRFCVDATPRRRRDLRVNAGHYTGEESQRQRSTGTRVRAKPLRNARVLICVTIADAETIALRPCQVPTSAFVCLLAFDSAPTKCYQARTDVPSAAMVKEPAAAGTPSAAYVLRH